MTYLVLELNNDEYGRGNNRPVHFFDDRASLDRYLLSCQQDISRLEIFEGRKLKARLEIVDAETY